MPKTLDGALPELENNIRDILKQASYNAYMTAVPAVPKGDIEGGVVTLTENAAKAFSEKFAEMACGPLANAIYNFVKEIGITATPKTLSSPNGPVTGTINLDEFIVI